MVSGKSLQQAAAISKEQQKAASGQQVRSEQAGGKRAAGKQDVAASAIEVMLLSGSHTYDVGLGGR